MIQLTSMILAVLCTLNPLDASLSAADEAWQKLEQIAEGKQYTGAERWGLAYREAGLEFWKRFPDDPRRYQWLWMTVAHGRSPHYFKNIDEAERAMKDPQLRRQTQYYERDEVARAAWDKMFHAMYAEMLALPGFEEEFRSRIGRHHLEGVLRSDQLAHRTDLRRVQEEVLELAALFPDQRVADPLWSTVTYAPYAFGLAHPKAMRDFLAPFKQSPNAHLRDYVEDKERYLRFADQPIDLKFTAFDGREIDLVELKGKVVFLNVWSCG